MQINQYNYYLSRWIIYKAEWRNGHAKNRGDKNSTQKPQNRNKKLFLKAM